MTQTAKSLDPSTSGLPTALLFAVAAVGALGINMYLPSMPRISRDFGVSFAAAQLTFSVFLCTLAVGQLFAGHLSDRLGRRPVLLVGLCAFTFGSCICTMAQNFDFLILGRVVQAIGGSVVVPICRAAVRDVHQPNEAASLYAYVTMGMSVASMFGPLIGGLLDACGWRASFLFMTTCATLTLSCCYAGFHETRRSNNSTGSAPTLLLGYFDLVRSRLFWGYAMVVAFVSSSFYCLIAGAPYVMIQLMGRSPAEYGLYSAAMPCGYILGSFATGRLVTRTGPNRMIGTFLALASMGTMALAFASGMFHPLSLCVSMFFIGAANGLVLPNGAAGAVSVKPELAGAAAGLSGSLQIGFTAVTASVVGAMLTTTVWPLIVIITVCLLCALASFWFLTSTRRFDLPRRSKPAA